MHRERNREKYRKWYRKHREREKARSRAYYREHGEHLRAKRREWYKRNAEAENFARKCGIPIARARVILKELDRRKEEREKMRGVPRTTMHTDVL